METPYPKIVYICRFPVAACHPFIILQVCVAHSVYYMYIMNFSMHFYDLGILLSRHTSGLIFAWLIKHYLPGQLEAVQCPSIAITAIQFVDTNCCSDFG